MAIYIPIVSEFKSAGIDKAKKEFKSLEGFSKKTGFLMKKALLPATAALGAVTAGLFDATKAAIDDAAAQDLLANNLKKTTKATDLQVQAVENWIAEQGKLLGITDDDIRPAFSRLAKATGSVTKAQELLTQSFDIAAATSKPLATVVQAVERAYGGNMTALAKLAPEYRNLIKKGASFEQIMGKIAAVTQGAASEAANTAAGKFARLKVSMDETKESVGAALMPVIEAALPILQKFADWASNNPDAFLAIAAAITAVSVAIMAVNVAMALNPFTAIAAGIALLVTGIVLAYKKFETFRQVVNKIANFVLGYFELIINGWIMVINGIIRGYNIIPGLPDIDTLSHVTLPRIRSGNPGGDVEGLSQSRITALATGGIVTSPQIALIGEAGPEAVIPLDKLDRMGGDINIHVTAGVGDPTAIGREVARVLAAYDRRAGRVA